MTGLSYTKNVVCVQIICAFIVVIVYLSTAEGVINIFFWEFEKFSWKTPTFN